MNTGMTRGGDELKSAGELRVARRWRRIRIAGTVLVGLAVLGGWGLKKLIPIGPPARFEDPEEQFKYGSLGQLPGFPYELFRVLPDVFKDRLPRPGGWEVFGFIDEGRGHPIGFARQTVGIDSLSFNCALCHTGTWRSNATDQAQIVLGAPSGTLDFDAFLTFLLGVVEDKRFNEAVLMKAIAVHTNLPPWEQWIYRRVVIPVSRHALDNIAEAELAWKNERPRAGCGRMDAFNLLKINIMGMKDDGSIGTSDMLPIWNQKARDGMAFHWNASGTNHHTENLISTYSVNFGPFSFLPEAYQRQTNFTWHLKPPEFPFAIDRLLAEKGRLVYARHCARCHDPSGSSTGRIVPQHITGTDGEFLAVWTDEFRERLDGIGGDPYAFDGLRPSDGFKAVLLDGCWMRAPYLHNGSVPSLADLLSPWEERPKHFHRGYDVYDPERMGFVSEGDEAREAGTLFETSYPGNSNAGHNWGTDLPSAEKRALLEFLKTL
jgi:hypothetical protein